MRRFLSVLASVVLAGALLAGCGGGSKKTIDVPGGGKITTSDKLPSSFPGDFPIYNGAKVQGSLSGTSNGISGTTVTWETGDSIDKVKNFYNDQFDKDSWKSNANGTISDGAYWSGENKDGSKAFYAFASAQDGKTNIVVTVGDNQNAGSGSTSSKNKTATADAGSESGDDTPTDSAGSGSGNETPTPGPLPPEVKLDKNFPSDRAPLPSGARVTSTSSFGSGTSKTFIIAFLTKDSPDKVAQYFSDEMPKHGWSDAFSSNSNGDYFVTFTSGDTSSSTNDALTVGASESTDNPGYTEVSLTVSIVAASG